MEVSKEELATSTLKSRGTSLTSPPESTGDTVTVAAFDPAVFDAKWGSDPLSSGRELSDLEATLEIPVTFRPAPAAAAPSMSADPKWPPTAAMSSVAPPKKGVLSGLVILTLGVVLTVWLCATLIH
jgi:hypothetical protein